MRIDTFQLASLSVSHANVVLTQREDVKTDLFIYDKKQKQNNECKVNFLRKFIFMVAC